MSEVFTVFYCWQSDTDQDHARHLIREALDAAADRISNNSTIPYRVAIHADTEHEPGLCNIPETILRRLREADAVVSDLSFVAKSKRTKKPKLCSNPNVLFELGYAFKAIGPERLICVMNEAHGASAKQIFDLAHHRRPIGFTSPCDNQSRAVTVEKFSKMLEGALLEVIKHGLSGGYGGDDEIMFQRQLSEIDSYWRSISKLESREPSISFVFHPTLFRKNRWPDAESIEQKVMKLGAHTNRFEKYPPQPTGNAPMNWGLYNDTYGDPWTLTYAGQFWTEMRIGAFGSLNLSQRDAKLSPEPPPVLELTDGQWISMENTLSTTYSAFQFMRNLCSEFADSEFVRWSLVASNLEGKWLSPPLRDARGPSKARSIERNGEVLVSDFKSKWIEIFADFAKDFCDVFCRDGRVFTRAEMKQFKNSSGEY